MVKILRAKESFEPLWRKGDEFVIVKRNTNPDLTEIEAKKLRSGRIYGFSEGELV